LLDDLTTIVTHGHGSYVTTSFNKFEIFDPFDVEIFFLHNNMWLEVIKVIKPFLEFLKSFDAQYVHNMMAIMLDPRFKVSHIMEYLVGSGNLIRLVSKYDVKVVIPFSMAYFDQLNLTTTSYVALEVNVVKLKIEENMFGVGGLN
jgi:hypothetical protein